MKTSIFVQGLDSSKRFESSVLKKINKAFESLEIQDVDYVYILDAGMQLRSGYNSYVYFVIIELDDFKLDLSIKTNNSCDWDYQYDAEHNRNYSNFLKNLVLNVLDTKIDFFVEEYFKDKELEKTF